MTGKPGICFACGKSATGVLVLRDWNGVQGLTIQTVCTVPCTEVLRMKRDPEFRHAVRVTHEALDEIDAILIAEINARVSPVPE